MMIVDDQEDSVMKKFYHRFVIIVGLCLASSVWASDLPSARPDPATAEKDDSRSTCGPIIEVRSLPYDTNATLLGAGDDCGIRNAADQRVTPGRVERQSMHLGAQARQPQFQPGTLEAGMAGQ